MLFNHFYVCDKSLLTNRAQGRPVSLSVLLSEFRALLESAAGASKKVVITGEFNIHVDDLAELNLLLSYLVRWAGLSLSRA